MTIDNNTTEELSDQSTEDVKQEQPVAETPPTEKAPADSNTARREAIAKAFEKYETPEQPAKADAKVEEKPADPVDPITGQTLTPINPPASLTPALREKWGGVDRQFQQYWIDRERHMAQTMQQTAEDRKFAKELKDIFSPHEEALTKIGTTAAKHVTELLDLSRALHMGSSQQRAVKIVDLIRHFQPDAATMQALFAGQPVSVPQFQAPARQRSEEEIARQFIEKQEEAKLEQEVARVREAFASDPNNEFFSHVSVKMGHLIYAGLATGTTTDELFRAAYDMAVANDPEVQGVLKQRAAATATPAALPRSVKPSLGTGKSNGSLSRTKGSRSAAEAAFESLYGTA